MSDQEMLDAYERALRTYERAKACAGNRVEAFAQLISAETVLVNHFGPEALKQYRDRSLPCASIYQRMTSCIPATIIIRSVADRSIGNDVDGLTDAA